MKPISEPYHESRETPAEEAREHRTGVEARPPKRGKGKRGKGRGRGRGKIRSRY